MKNSRLRKQIDDLESEKRRLLLAREVSLSPAEIDRRRPQASRPPSPMRTAEFASATTLRTSCIPHRASPL